MKHRYQWGGWLTAFMLVGMALAPASARAVVWGSATAYARGAVAYSSSSWNGVKATIEVRNATVSSADAGGAYVHERLKVNRQNNGDDVLELGYSVESTGGGPWVLLPYMLEKDGLSISMYFIDWPIIETGVAYEFKFVEQGGNRWYPYIGTCPARSAYYTYLTWAYPDTNQFSAGLITNCSTTRIANSADNVNITVMKKSDDAGLTWTNGPDDGFAVYDPNTGVPQARGAWVTPGRSSYNRRNDY